MINLRPKIAVFLRCLLGVGLFLVVVSLIIEYGFHSSAFHDMLHQLQLILAGVLSFVLLGRLLISKDKLSFIRDNQGYFILVILFLLVLVWIYCIPVSQFVNDFLAKFPKVGIRVFAVQVYLVIYLLFSLGQINQLINSIRGSLLRPILLIPFIFIGIILIGTLLLLLPRATPADQPLSLVDALFTATSATCVTGLIVKDTGTHFSRIGQLIILTLVQIGALGIMTFTTFFGFILGRRIGVKEGAFLGEALSLETLSKIGRLVLGILVFTFSIEIIGAALLFWRFIPYFGPNLHNFYLSVFHSVSAFGNAGFSLFSDSFMRFRNQAGINLIVTTLIIVGGLGFVVIFDVLRWFKKRIKHQRQSLLLHTKLVLVISLLLVVLGTVFLFAREDSATLVQLSLKEKLLSSYFQSVTARTAGFNTLPISGLAPFSALLLIFFMFVGASPGSTAGGIKTTGLGVIFATIKSWLTGGQSVRIFKRTLSRTVIRQAFCIFFLALAWIGFATFILLQTENAGLMDVLFEEVSAFGTVGLSRGITFNLSLIGKIIIIISMFFGRLGPLIIAMFVANRSMSEKYRYPEERVILG